MFFCGKWITTEDFVNKNKINVFHKEFEYIDENQSEGIKNYHTNFRKQFTLKKNGLYQIYISADDYYKLYINEKFVGQGPAPAYFDCYNYNIYDITDYLCDGENVIAVQVYYQGTINRVWNSGDNRQGMIAHLLCNGSVILGTDKSWQYKIATEYSGEFTGYRTMFLENIDFNRKDRVWKKQLEIWDGCKNAQENVCDDHIFKGATDVVKEYRIKPQLIKKISEGTYFLDFGSEITGSLSMIAKGEKGQRVTIKYGEETEENNQYSVKYEVRCDCTYLETCTLSGGLDEFEFYDYKGFRYAQIETHSNCIDEDEIYALVRHHEFDENKSSLKCNNKLIEQIWEICKNTLKVCTQEGFLDCPTREKGQYLGDFTVSGLAYLYLTGDSEIYKKTLYDFAESQRICRGMMAVAPGSFMQEIADYSLQFPLQLYNYYQYTGDIDTLRELLPAAEGILDYFADYKRHDGLLFGVDEKWNMVDWPKNLRDDYDCETIQGKAPEKCHNAINSFYLGAVLYTEKCMDILGIEYSKTFDQLKEAYLKVFYDEEKKVFVDAEYSKHASLHSNALAAFIGVVPEQAKQSVKDLIMQKGLCCGVYMSYFVLKALAGLGAYSEEYELLTNNTEHSWANMLREGATTCFEAWGKNQKWNTSLCHAWACSPVIVLAEDFMGIDSSTFKTGKAKYAPNLPEDVELKLCLPVKGKSILFKK